MISVELFGSWALAAHSEEAFLHYLIKKGTLIEHCFSKCCTGVGNKRMEGFL